jgi:hypothetical protein
MQEKFRGSRPEPSREEVENERGREARRQHAGALRRGGSYIKRRCCFV